MSFPSTMPPLRMEYIDVSFLTAFKRKAITVRPPTDPKNPNRIERRAQLVAHRRKELILELTGPLHFLFARRME